MLTTVVTPNDERPLLTHDLRILEDRLARRLPKIYVPASVRNVTPVDDIHREIGVGFNLPDGSVVRLGLSVDFAEDLAEMIVSSLQDHVARTHSPMSSGLAGQ